MSKAKMTDPDSEMNRMFEQVAGEIAEEHAAAENEFILAAWPEPEHSWAVGCVDKPPKNVSLTRSGLIGTLEGSSDTTRRVSEMRLIRYERNL